MLCEMKDILMTWITETTEGVMETYQSWCIFLFLFGLCLFICMKKYLQSLTTKLCGLTFGQACVIIAISLLKLMFDTQGDSHLD